MLVKTRLSHNGVEPKTIKKAIKEFGIENLSQVLYSAIKYPNKESFVDGGFY